MTYSPQTMGGTLNNESTVTGPLPEIRQQPILRGNLNAYYWRQIFALDSVDVKTQTLLNSHPVQQHMCAKQQCLGKNRVKMKSILSRVGR